MFLKTLLISKSWDKQPVKDVATKHICSFITKQIILLRKEHKKKQTMKPNLSLTNNEAHSRTIDKKLSLQHTGDNTNIIATYCVRENV